MTPTNKQLLIIFILLVALIGFGFLVTNAFAAFKNLSLVSLNFMGVETSASFNMPPARITNVAYKIENGQVKLSWDPIVKSRLNGYRVYRGNSSDALFIIGASNQAVFIDEDVQKRETYYYQITAVNDLGEGHPSFPIRVRIITR